MGCANATMVTPPEYIGGFPWSKITYNTQASVRLKSTPVVVAQYVRMYSINHRPDVLGYEIIMRGGARAKKLVVFNQLTLSGPSSVNEVHCLSSTMVETNKLVSMIGTIYRRSRKELVEMAKEMAGLGPEVTPQNKVRKNGTIYLTDPPPDGPETGTVTAGDAPMFSQPAHVSVTVPPRVARHLNLWSTN